MERMQSKKHGGNGIRTALCLVLTCVLFCCNPIDCHAASKYDSAMGAYARLLEKKKYQYKTEENMVTTPTQFALQDLDADGVPELIISPEGTIVSDKNLFYTYNGWRAVKLNSADVEIPAWGTFVVSHSRESFFYYREGPAYYDEVTDIGVMPYGCIEYAIRGKRVEEVGNYSMNLYDDGHTECEMNGILCTVNDYYQVVEAFSEPVTFYNNTEEYRRQNRLISEKRYTGSGVLDSTEREMLGVVIQAVGAIIALVLIKKEETRVQ